MMQLRLHCRFAVVSASIVFAFGGAFVSVAATRDLRPVPLLLGRSEDGRPIVAVHAGNPTGTRMLVVGCIHGTECAGIAVARALEHVQAPLDLWIVPNLNPDGYARATRQNGRGVDLNANWSSQWRGGGRPWDVYYPGPRPFSERETRIARDLILRIHPAGDDLVPPAHEPRLGLGAEQRGRADLCARRRDALLPPPLAGRDRHQLAKPPPGRLGLVHRRASSRQPLIATGAPPGTRGTRRRRRRSCMTPDDLVLDAGGRDAVHPIELV